MKALVIGLESEEFLQTKLVLENHVDKANLFYLSSEHELISILTSEGPFSFIIHHLDDKRFQASAYHEQVTEVIGLRPYLYIGTQNAIKSQLTTELVNNHKTNFVLEVPLKPQELKKAVSNCLTWIKNEEFEQSIQEFSKDEMRPMRLKNFFLFESLPYDVYIEVANNKYGKVISKNRFYSHKLIQNYSKKNIKSLHVKKTEHLKMLDSSIKNFTSVFKMKNIDKSKIIKLQLKAIFFIQEYIKALSVSDEVNELTHLLTDSISDQARLVKSFPLIAGEITQFKNMAQAEVSLLSAYLCELILVEMKWNADMTKGRLTLASILQDIHLSNDELYKIRSTEDQLLKTFTEEEQKQFLEHPKRAQDIAKLFHGYTELDFILKEHHEHPTGEGFPSSLNSSGLTTISCLFIIVNHFLSRIDRNELGIAAAKDILSSMKKPYSMGNFKEPMNALIKIITMP